MDYLQALRARADEMMSDAPGALSVRRLSHIDEVRALRAAREVLTEQEAHDLALVRLDMIERLRGVAVAPPPIPPRWAHGRFGAVMLALTKVAKGMSPTARAESQHEYMVRQAGGPAVMPAPIEVIDAAEAWVISHVVADRIDVDVAVLRGAWEDMTIESVAP